MKSLNNASGCLAFFCLLWERSTAFGPSNGGRIRVLELHSSRHPKIATSFLFSATPNDDEDDFEDDEDTARSQFGTRSYWDDVYLGRGDFPAEEYSWYFGWEILEDYVKEYIPLLNEDATPTHVLCPGVGNDSILVDLHRSKYQQLTAFDYSEHAIERQDDLLSYELGPSYSDTVELHTMDARKLPDPEWTHRFDAIIEKGGLDAIYLSGDGNVERAIDNLHRCLRPGGILLSVSGVVPPDLRKECFQDWEWIRDGSEELKAGCFVLKKPIGD